MLGKKILDITPKAQRKKEKISNLAFIKIKNIFSSKDTDKKMKRQAEKTGEKYFQIISLIKGLYSEYIFKKTPVFTQW